MGCVALNCRKQSLRVVSSVTILAAEPSAKARETILVRCIFGDARLSDRIGGGLIQLDNEVRG